MIKVLIGLSLLAACSAVESDAEILPQQQAENNPTQKSAAQRAGKGNVDARSERLQESWTSGLRQPHVYLPDGRLQPVEYITSPLISHPSPPQYQLFREPVDELAMSPGKGLVQYVEYPEAGYQQYTTPNSAISYLLPGSKGHHYQVVKNVQYIEEPADLGIEYLPFPGVAPNQLSPYRISEVQESKVLAGEDVSSRPAVRQEKPQEPRGYLPANLKYTQIQQVAAPVYTYAAQPLVRILSYSPQHI